MDGIISITQFSDITSLEWPSLITLHLTLVTPHPIILFYFAHHTFLCTQVTYLFIICP